MNLRWSVDPVRESQTSIVVGAVLLVGFPVHAQWATDGTKIITNCTTPPCLVGVGTPAPYTHLVVRRTSAAASVTAHTTASASIQGSNNVDVAIGTDPASPFGAWIQARHNTIDFAYPLALQPAGGNVGIGTLNPAQKLEVRQSPDGAHSVSVSTPVSAAMSPNTPIGGLRLTWQFGQIAPNHVDLQVVRGAGAADGAGLSIAGS